VNAETATLLSAAALKCSANVCALQTTRHLLQVYAFGSHSSGLATRTSDVDLVVTGIKEVSGT
jgi:predicted nucleotidyltransferase